MRRPGRLARAVPGAAYPPPSDLPWSLGSPPLLIGGALYIAFGSGVAAGLLGAIWAPLAPAAPFLPALSIPWWMARDRRLISAVREAAPQR